jgi:hypothetical protein
MDTTSLYPILTVPQGEAYDLGVYLRELGVMTLRAAVSSGPQGIRLALPYSQSVPQKRFRCPMTLESLDIMDVWTALGGG